MTMQSFVMLLVFLVTLLSAAYPLGVYLAKVGEGTPIRGLNWMKKAENFLYRLAGVPLDSEMEWKNYALALLVFNMLGALVVYAVQRLQAWLPLNPSGVGQRES
jgi:K+-transporting ATPase ATPase A chain